MSLTDREKEQLKAMIDAGEPLPPKYRAALFADPHEAELIWPGKTSEVTSVVLPFQSIEQIDEPRAEMNAPIGGLFDFDSSTGRQAGGWTNKLIWGDNKLVLANNVSQSIGSPAGRRDALSYLQDSCPDRIRGLIRRQPFDAARLRWTARSGASLSSPGIS